MTKDFLKKWHTSLDRLVSTQTTKHILLYGIYLYVIALLAIMFSMCFSAHFWYDEAFSLELVQHNYCEIISLTARDVHPPLYYIILKLIASLITNLSGGHIGLVTAAKFVSFLPIIILCFICFTYIKREYGQFVAALSSLWLCLAPSFFQYALEIRMYSWALLFVSIAFLASIRLMTGVGKRLEWIIFTASVVGAAYTHYFAGLAAGILFAWLFCFRFFTHQSNKHTVIAALVAALLYLPWFAVFFQQLSVVRSNYWIPATTIWTIVEYAYFVLGDVNNKITLVHALLVSYILYVIVLRCFRDQRKDHCMLLGAILPFLLISIGLILTVLIRPIFIIRYVFPVLFCFWLAISLCLTKLNSSRVFKIGITALLVVITSCNFIKASKSELQSHYATQNVINYMKDYENPCFISTNPFHYQTAAALLAGTGMIWKTDIPNPYAEVYNFKIIQINTVAELHGAVMQRPSFFIETAKKVDAVQKFARETHTKAEKVISGSVGLPVDIYKLSLEEPNSDLLH